MAIASYRIYTTHTTTTTPTTILHNNKTTTTTNAVHTAMTVYFIQLFFNFIWSFIYFHYHSLLGAMLDCYVLVVLIGITMRQFYGIDEVAGWLLLPYLVWSCYASYLSTGIYLLNGERDSTKSATSTAKSKLR